MLDSGGEQFLSGANSRSHGRQSINIEFETEQLDETLWRWQFLKKPTCALLIVSLILLATSYVAWQPAWSQTFDFDAYLGTQIPDGSIDGTIGTELDDSGHYTSVAIDPSGTAEIWTKNDGTNVYIAVRFTADSSNPWITLQLGADTCMDNSADAAVFGDDSLAASGYSDAYFPTGSSVNSDTSQNGVGAMVVDAGNVVTIELKKPLNSGDTAGKDINWAPLSINNIVVDWDSNGGGSSGGSANHRGGSTPTGRKVRINTVAVTEFATLTLVAALLVLTVLAVFIAKKLMSKANVHDKP